MEHFHWSPSIEAYQLKPINWSISIEAHQLKHINWSISIEAYQLKPINWSPSIEAYQLITLFSLDTFKMLQCQTYNAVPREGFGWYRISCLWHHIHHLYIPLYTNSWSDFLQTLFEAHILDYLKVYGVRVHYKCTMIWIFSFIQLNILLTLLFLLAKITRMDTHTSINIILDPIIIVLQSNQLLGIHTYINICFLSYYYCPAVEPDIGHTHIHKHLFSILLLLLCQWINFWTYIHI